MSDRADIKREELRTWILEELDQNLRLLTAIGAFRFRNELMPQAQLRRIKLHHQYLLRLLERCETPAVHGEDSPINEAMQELASTLEKDRLELLKALPDSEKVASLYHDPAWNHHNRHVQLSFAPEDMLKEEQEEKERVERRAISAKARLRTALQGLPVHWLKVIHSNLELRYSDEYTKPRLIAGIATKLGSPKELNKLIASLSRAQAALLDAVAEKDGVLPLDEVCERFGDDYIDGYWWDVHPPQTVLGSVRALGLLFVGILSGTGEPVAVMPAELRPAFGGDSLPDNVVIFPGKGLGKFKR